MSVCWVRGSHERVCAGSEGHMSECVLGQRVT